MAARTLSTLQAIFEHAMRVSKIPTDPAKGVRKLASMPRERRLSRAEIERLGETLRAAAEDREHPTGPAAIRLLLLTGFRRMEGLGVERPWLDKAESATRFPDTKSGAQTHAIGQAAIDVLLAQPETKSSFFFPAVWGERHFIGVIRVLDRFCERAGLADIMPHTLRHTFGSLAGDLGLSELTIAALLERDAFTRNRFPLLSYCLRSSLRLAGFHLIAACANSPSGGRRGSAGSRPARRPQWCGISPRPALRAPSRRRHAA